MPTEKISLPSCLLKSGETLLPCLWQNHPDPIITTNLDFSDISLNPAAISLMQRVDQNRQALSTVKNLFNHLVKTASFSSDRPTFSELNFNNFWFSVHTFNVYDKTYLVVIKDISEARFLKEKLERLEETNSELNEIFEVSADGLVSVDQSGRILRLNTAYKRILGIKDENFIGKPARLLVERGYLSQVVSPLVLKDHKAKNIVVTIKGKEVLLTGRPVFNEQGKLIRIIANIRDLTRLNNLKNQLKKYHELANRYETEIHHLRAKEMEAKIIGHSIGISKMIALAEQASKVDSTVLIYGETGTGKEVLVKTIHRLSERKNGPFIAVNCSSIPESLIESELFGYEAGSFTGSNKKGKRGLFEAANGGTLFLDEISEMSISMQSKVLRVIQERKIRRLGASKDNRINVRIIAASNKKLKKCVSCGDFRADLFYRLNIINIDIPPLRERKEDIPLLVNYFLGKYNKKFNRNKTISEKEILQLIGYDWPGNIRELENIIERFVVLSGTFLLDSTIFEDTANQIPTPSSVTCLKSYLEECESNVILTTYKKFKSTRETANALDISQSTVVRKIAKYKRGH
jgi:PAS domain S-box-containing protein